MMILRLTGHPRTAVKMCPCKELWPNTLFLPRKSACAVSEDKITVKSDNTEDVGTCMRFQRRSLNYQKEESDEIGRRQSGHAPPKCQQHTHTMSANNSPNKKNVYF